MGCCASTDKIINSSSKSGVDLNKLSTDEAAKAITDCVDNLIKIFEKHMIEKLNPSKPCGEIEFDQTLRVALYTINQIFLDKFYPLPTLDSTFEIYEKFKLYLFSKCKSNEGYYRFLNDFYSFERNVELITRIAEAYCSGELDEKAAIEMYQRQARGTFVIEGLQDMYDILRMGGREEIMGFIHNKAENVRSGLEERRSQLERVSRKLLLFAKPGSVSCSPGISLNENNAVLVSQNSISGGKWQDFYIRDEKADDNLKTFSISNPNTLLKPF